MSGWRRYLDRILTRLEVRLGRPTLADLTRQDRLWDYAEASRQVDWDAEADLDALRAAMALRATDSEAAFQALLELAEAGSVVAMVEVGESFFWDRREAGGVEQAEKWLRLADQLGSRRALLSYGTLLLWERDLLGAEAVFSKGAAADWSPAIFRLAKLRLDHPRGPDARAEGFHLLERATAMGHPAAKRRLGREMALGRLGWRNIIRGFRMSLEYIHDASEAWRSQEAEAAARLTASGETVH